jgi:hypothetical protein
MPLIQLAAPLSGTDVPVNTPETDKRETGLKAGGNEMSKETLKANDATVTSAIPEISQTSPIRV